MRDVEKDDRLVCSSMLKGLCGEYSGVRESIIIVSLRNREQIERHLRNKCLEMSASGRITKMSGHALCSEDLG